MISLINKIILPYKINLKNPVLIYQMGKVASSSIYESLKSTNNINVFHIHRLYPANIEKVRQEHLQKGIKPQNEDLGLYLYKKIIHNKKPAKIISLIREPISRNISAFFQNLDAFENRENAHSNIEVTDLIRKFLKNYNHDVPLNWFDDEMKKTTGIDVFKEEFPKESGYKTYYIEPLELLVLKHNLDDTLKSHLLSDFLKLKDLSIIRTNVGTSKNYSDKYIKFLKGVKLPTDYIEKMLSSKYSQHFFTDNEIKNIYQKWTEK